MTSTHICTHIPAYTCMKEKQKKNIEKKITILITLKPSWMINNSGVK